MGAELRNTGFPWEKEFTEGVKPGGYYFIGTPLIIDLQFPVELTEQLHIERADDFQIAHIRRSILGNRWFFNSRMTYEQEFKIDPTDPGHQTLVPIPKEQWRYFVLAYSGLSNEAETFLRAAALACPVFSCYPQIMGTSEPFGKGELTSITSFGGVPYEFSTLPVAPYPVIDASVVEQWRNLYLLLSKFNHAAHAGVVRAIALFHELKQMSGENRFLILGLFMIVEMLLTHNPNNKEIGDSLSHQLATKIPLLSKRFSAPLDYSAFRMTEVKVWKCLYQIRSKIAHGDIPDYSPFGGRDSTERFLASATKLLLIQALKEPDLIESLKPI